MKKVAINSFVKRQTPESEFTHYDGDLNKLALFVTGVINMPDAWAVKPGYRDGVLRVVVPPDDFYTGIVQLQDGDRLIGEFKAREAGEFPRQSIYVESNEGKRPAKYVEIILYAHDVLAETDQAETDADYEIVSINGFPTEEDDVPIPPMTLLHNHFGSDGGTDTNLSAEELEAKLRESFNYWKDKAKLPPKDFL